MKNERNKQVVVIGAGPAGLTAAYELTKHSYHPIVIEKQRQAGGLSRTENYKGFHFDMGGHRFYSKSQAANMMWKEVLGKDFLLRPRLSRIYYEGKFFHYPIQFVNALMGLGIWEATQVISSYIKWQIFPYKEENTFEQWVTNRFGKRLFEIFFKTYTEKVWGIPCSKLKAEWAAQRIKELSMKNILLRMFVKSQNPVDSLIDEFHYPRFGPGMLWNRVAELIEKRGGSVLLDCNVHKIIRIQNRIEGILVSCNGKEETITGTDFISSMPISELIMKMDPVPEEVLQSARKLTYRDFITVCLIVNNPQLFPDNWLYIHSPEVKVGRIQNFKNWSPDMVPDSSKTSIGLEYFCKEGDEFWNLRDEELIELGKKEAERISLVKYDEIIDGCVFRVPKAYPVYDSDYKNHLEILRNFIDSLENLQTIGRNGLHRYNNQDHSMITGMLSVRNIVHNEKNDLWNVNSNNNYNEEVNNKEVKELDLQDMLLHTLAKVFTRIDPIAFGLSTGVTSGMVLFFATLFLYVKGGWPIGPTLSLLNNFLPGYRVNWMGSFLGFIYGFGSGFLFGWMLAYLRNLLVYIRAKLLNRDIETNVLESFLDFE